MKQDEPRTAFVTGGTRGIGLAVAESLRDSGHTVFVGSRNEPTALADSIHWVRCDVADTESVDSAFAHIEETAAAPGIVVSNAGITRDKLTIRMDESDFVEVIDTNLTGAYRVCRRAVRSMMKQRWGRLILMSSIVGSSGQTGQANYAASKAGLVGLGRSLAREFASRGITVNLVAPGPIQTEMLSALGDDAVEQISARVPVGRLGTPQDIAAAVSYLVSENAGFVTGTTLEVDGGMGMGGSII